MNIVMVGSGYVGLVSGACFSGFGHNVTCVDIDPEKIAALNSGSIPIFEPGLASLVKENASAGRLNFTTDLSYAVRNADAVFIAVGTPSRRGDGHADLSFVYEAARSIAAAIDHYTVVITKSTVPVGTGDEVERRMRKENPEADFSVVSNPEFLREGAAIEDFQRPDRVVVGAEDERAVTVMEGIYRPLSLNEAPVLFTDRRTAELSKYAGNAFLALKITFINEIADLSEKVGADVQTVARAIGLDKRIGPKFLNPGPGYGGSCFPKDTNALVKIAQDSESPVRLVETTVAINDNRKRQMTRRIVAACDGTVRDKKIAILGLTFKPETDDMRESPALSIVQGLLDAGARVRAYDPQGMKMAQQMLPDIEYATDAYDATRGADCVVLVTEWNEFRELNLKTLGSLMHRKVFVDLRNVYRKSEVESEGFHYSSIGRGGEHA